MLRTKQIAARMARTESAILLTGESGTGKELFAHSIHNASRRHDMPFVAINCAALSESLLESELFGYDEGAFTGAKKGGKLGLFEYAHRGTLFLDEIEGMSQTLQVKLLRVLQEKEFMRVGGNRIIPTDVRIIAASNEDILELVHQGAFRKDLYYRLNTLPIAIPPLRERGEDLFLIASHLMEKNGVRFTFSPEAKSVLRAYPWEGNVRELANLVEYLSMLGKDQVEVEDLPSYLRESSRHRPRGIHPIRRPTGLSAAGTGAGGSLYLPGVRTGPLRPGHGPRHPSAPGPGTGAADDRAGDPGHASGAAQPGPGIRVPGSGRQPADPVRPAALWRIIWRAKINRLNNWVKLLIFTQLFFRFSPESLLLYPTVLVQAVGFRFSKSSSFNKL